MNIIPNLPILHSKKTVCKFVFTQNYLQSPKLVYNFDEFLDRLSLWIKENNLIKEDAASKLGISRGLFRFWFNGGVISIGTYNKIKNNLQKYQLIY